ncbi:M3 family metallopeptidase [Hydrogenovibrio sp. 3SP14C1]|uniref:M3 family metallopeptidase n=1 Tax=Hydrogenovibrio sp. 3SP14C1 TaxID=3038774 RepID=UPI002417A5F3|nr:M3 family metallopeptidase [Hydrogenovibrio sp. 3SP14C1]MDG4813553.1 M3 family metallopeptidase [Hydrogenovibrio sp. 3SP14C1]
MNPLLQTDQLPNFEAFHVEHIVPAVETLLSENLAEIEALVNVDDSPTWENFVEPLEVLNNRLERVWGPVGHLDGVKNSDEWHQAYTSCLEKITDFYTKVGQDQGLFKKFQQIAQSSEFEKYSLAQKKVIENALRDFRLSGIDLPKDKQAEYKSLSQQLSQLSSQFGNNVLKSTQAWSKFIENEEALSGLPEGAMGLLAQLAEQKEAYQGKKGWLVTLDFPSYLAVMTHADSRALREEVYQAFATRASEKAQDPQYDNSDIIEKILKLRHEKAQLLGFEHYAELSLATKMAGTPEQVIGFLRDLAQKSKPQAEKELATLSAFAKKELGIDTLHPWDVTYASEKFKNATLSLSQEKLRPYFPVTKVLEGLFNITETLFEVSVKEKQGVSVWHDDVRYFEILDQNGQKIAAFYLDLYARENKRGGAWMDSAISRWRHPSGELQSPVAYLVCNFTPPIGNQPACLTHDEVTTLFHEFGHGLHHMLTEMENFDVSGINGVPWDAVELPSQFMENFCWERAGIDQMTAHIETGDVLPDDLFEALQQSRGFQSAMMMVRQLEFGLFDFLSHSTYNPIAPQPVLELVNQVRQEVAVIMPPDYNRFAQSFSHIFAGGYAAGYFSYKWAEVLSSDAFSLFEEEGILNPEIGVKFKNTILAAGGSVHPMTLFKAFRGREPEIDALLRHSGIKAA